MKRTQAPSARLAPNPPHHSTAGIETLLPSEAPFTHLMLHPEKIDAVMQSILGQLPVQTNPSPQPAAKTGSARANKSAAIRKPESARKKTFFHLQGNAKSVQIAGDFTRWAESPIAMVSDGDGRWSAVVPLEPGQYAYRFIVDGEWCVDPSCARRVDNGFGGENSVIEVV